MTRPANVEEHEWSRAVMQARQDPHRLARLVRSGTVMRQRGVKALPLPPLVNTAIKPKRKKRGKK